MWSLFTIMGIMAVAVGTGGFFLLPVGLRMGLKYSLNLSKNGMVYPVYMKPPFRGRAEYHLYSVKNPGDVLKGRKMAFEFKGPYKFDFSLHRENIKFSPDNEQVDLESGRWFYFREDISANFDERMWLLNPIVPTTSLLARKMLLDRIPFRRIVGPVVMNSITVLFETYNEHLIMKTTPREFLAGRKVTLLAQVGSVIDRLNLGSLVPSFPPGGVFGIVFAQNTSTDAIGIWTGLGKTRDRFAEVERWRGSKDMKIWRGRCNKIVGTNGELFKPLLVTGKPIKVFQSQFCRSFEFDPVSNQTVTTNLGLNALEYEISKKLFMGVRNNSKNECFCTNARDIECQYDGLIPMGPCFFDSPVFLSKPNYQGVHPKIKDTVRSETTGLTLPKQSLYIEPLTGTVLEANVTVLGHLKITRENNFRELSRLPEVTYAPFFSTTDLVEVPYEYIWQVYFLQKFYNNHGLLTLSFAATGAGILAAKLLLK